MTDAEIKEFTDWLTQADGGGCEVAVCHVPNGLWYGFKRLMFHWTLVVGEIGNRHEMTDRWCYATDTLAELAMTEWASRGFKGEPNGWHRHPATGRRRPNGDSSKEYIAL